MQLIIALVVALMVVVSALKHDIILTPDASKTGPEGFLIFMQGADILPEQYLPLLKVLQAQSPLKLWVGIPEYIKDEVNPLDIGHGIERIKADMVAKGMQSTFSFYGGHSLGGAMIQMWVDQNKNKENITGQILMGSFLTRTWKNNYVFGYETPTLTIGGELDGLARVTRIAEAYYTQLMDNAASDAYKSFPVTLLEGVTHMQFASGTPPELVAKRDLLPEISYEKAHMLIADDMLTFMNMRISGDVKSTQKMRSRVQESGDFFKPIIDALIMEGYHNFRPPCLCTTDICEPQPTCTAACPFTSQFSQPSMSSGVSGLTVNNADSFHDVWETEPTVHLPTIKNSCSSPEGCVLNTTTITQGVYHTGEDLEIWKKHFDIAFADTGFAPITARELRTKMSSRQNTYSHAGLQVGFDEVDGGGVRCGEINQKAIDWATNNAASNTVNRFKTHGQSLLIGKDIDVCPAGPCWIWRELNFKESEDKESIVISSPQFSTATDFWLPKTRGFHYCKVLSPARVTEWIYVDGLRAKYSLASQMLAGKM